MDIAFYSQKRAVAIGRNDEIVAMIARMDRCEEVLAPVLDPPYRMLDLAREGSIERVWRFSYFPSSPSWRKRRHGRSARSSSS